MNSETSDSKPGPGGLQFRSGEFEQSRRNSRLVTLGDADHKIGKPLAGMPIQETHHAKIQKTDHVARENMDVARMRIGMEKAVIEDLPHHQRGKTRGDLPAIEIGGVQIGQFRGLDAVHVFHRQYAAGGGPGMNSRHVDRRIAGELIGESFEMRGLRGEIQFLFQPPGELGHHQCRPMDAPSLQMGFEQRGQMGHDLKVNPDHVLDARTLHLHHYPLSAVQHGAMHLRYGSRAERSLLEGKKAIANRAFQLLFHHGADLGEGDRRHLIQQFGQLARKRGRKQVSAPGEKLSELDEGRPQLLERFSEPLGLRKPGGRILLAASLP